MNIKKLATIIATTSLLVCLVAGCNAVETGKNAVKEGAQQVEKGADALVNDGKAMMNDEKGMLESGNSMNDGNSSMANGEKIAAEGDRTKNNGNSLPTNEEKAKFIGEEKAKEIALKKANVTTESVIFDIIEIEKENGVWQYEVDFKKDTTEYDAKINAIDGTILEWEMERD